MLEEGAGKESRDVLIDNTFLLLWRSILNPVQQPLEFHLVFRFLLLQIQGRGSLAHLLHEAVRSRHCGIDGHPQPPLPRTHHRAQNRCRQAGGARCSSIESCPPLGNTMDTPS